MKPQVETEGGNSPNDMRRAGDPKKFECSHLGCKKKFTRMEHMQRHALNHTVGDSTCPRCNAHFKRPDLLARHMKRHQQRDLEAGGPGCGTLDTRKRAWKASDGTVVEKRSRTTYGTEPGMLTSCDNDELQYPAQIVSPPVSDEGRLGREFQLGFQDEDQPGICVDFEASSAISQGPSPDYAPQQFLGDYLQPAISMARPQLPLSHGQPEYHPALQPDTASSFNMPYTTALDYNWLFNLESATASGFGLANCQNGLPGLNIPQSQPAVHSEDVMMTEQSLHSPTPKPRTSTRLTSPAADGFDESGQSQRESAAPLSSSPLGGSSNRGRQQHLQTYTKSPTSRSIPPQGQRFRKTRDSHAVVRHSSSNSNDVLQRGYLHHQRPSLPENPLSMLRKPDILPQITEVARERLLVLIETAKPEILNYPLGSSIAEHPLLSHGSLQSWLDLFFLHFNTAYPLIHVSTFNAGEAEPLLLLSLVLLGATYGDKNAHQLAVCIHDVIRPLIFAHAGFSPRPELWTLQTILLVECFGKSRAGQKQHDFSHLFHGLLINLIRRSDCQSVAEQPQPPPEGTVDTLLHDTWRRWADLEQKKRLALLCFMWDTQHAVLFCQSLCMSAFELRCTMPCAQSLWEASDANSWATECRRSQHPGMPPSLAGPSFLSTLKAYLSTTTADSIGGDLNGLGLTLILHGIMSIAWDMQRRDQTSLGVTSIIGAISWRSRLSKAYDRWKVDFDQYCDNAAVGGDIPLTVEWKVFAAAYRAVYHAAQALLHMEFLDLQIYAGARHILGRPVQQQDYVRSSRIVKKWATKERERAAVASWHAASLIYEIAALKERDQDSLSERRRLFTTTYTNLFHVPWCLYLATLTAWAFHHARPLRQSHEAATRAHLDILQNFSEDEDDSSDEIVWDAQREMEALVKEMASYNGVKDASSRTLSGQGRKGTHGLVWVVADLLSTVRWGIVHAGVSVLRGLVPTRLINQYEDS